METSSTSKPSIDKQVKEYLASLDDVHRQTIEIAKQQLGDAYDTKTSIGFLTWKEKKGY